MPELLHAVASFVLAWAYLGSASPTGDALPSGLQSAALSITIEPGSFEPMYPAEDGKRTSFVQPFRLDRTPVTNAAFRNFVLQHPNFRRDRVSALFAEGNYLSHWSSAIELGSGAPEQAPVVNVSWFAARAYCAARGARLPSELEWEYVAAASESSRDARKDPAWSARILTWYSRPNDAVLADAGSGQPNAWGVYDLHGLVWEWVSDFNSTLISSDSRSSRATDKQTFCGAGATSARDVSDYANFMRIAFLSSLVARDSTHNLGFRCAADLERGS